MSNTITRPELQAALGELTVVDALPAGAYGRRHLPTAVNLAAEEIERAKEVLPDPDAPIVVYSSDTNCTRGPELTELLAGLGYRNLRLYQDGIEDWVAAGLPIEKAN